MNHPVDLKTAIPVRKAAPYLFHAQTTSLCEVCLKLVPAKILIEDDDVFYQKRCAEHGVRKTLISTDAAYWRSCKDYLKPGDRPLKPQTHTERGCPYDCGLCPDYEQHLCLAIIEVNEACNLSCPVCFADSSVKRTGHRDLATIEAMMDALVESEGEPDLLQISGGEPTIHPQFFEILDAAKRRPIRHLMINTNGVRIAKEPEFVARLAAYMPRFEVYLQFDSLKREAPMNLRGADLRGVRQQALEALEKHNISTTLVVTLKKGVNDGEVADIVRHALEWRCGRGVMYFGVYLVCDGQLRAERGRHSDHVDRGGAVWVDRLGFVCLRPVFAAGGKMSADGAPRQPVRHFIGLILIVAGALWLAASGLCSAAFFGMLVVEGDDFREMLSIVPMILLVSGFSAGVGFAVYVIGRALRPKV